MSIFSRVRKSRQQAKEHNAKLAEQQVKEGAKSPYKHVPTHAATDAIASAPPSWREADRQRVVEENRRRSVMAASGHHMNIPGIPRVGSSLSHVSYPTDTNANPMVRMPRACSYAGVSPYPANHSRNVYSVSDVTDPQFAATSSSKGKEVSRGPSYESPRTSPTFSKGESGSSSGSTSSQDDLEMKPTRIPAVRTTTAEKAHRLHPSHRRTSDSSIERIAMANLAKGTGSTNFSRDLGPPPFRRGFGSIAPITNAPTPTLQSPSPSNDLDSSHGSSTSLSSQVPTITIAPISALMPPAAPAAQPDGTVNWLSLPGQNMGSATMAESAGMAHTSAPRSPKDRKMSKTARFAELERIESHTKTPAPEDSYTAQSTAPALVVPQQIVVNVFPEEDSVPEPQNSKSKRFSKSGGRLTKKNRWASSKATAVAV